MSVNYRPFVYQTEKDLVDYNNYNETLTTYQETTSTIQENVWGVLETPLRR